MRRARVIFPITLSPARLNHEVANTRLLLTERYGTIDYSACFERHQEFRMTAIELIVKQLESSARALKSTLEDFTDAELLTRPAPAANHPLYQLGHLCSGEVHLMSYCRQGIYSNLPGDLLKRFDRSACTVDDPAKLATKAELIALFDQIRAQTIAYAKSLTDADLDKPTNIPFAPTIGEMLAMQAVHVAMHTGQMQVARRCLGKKILM
jgi:hypothetical protein